MRRGFCGIGVEGPKFSSNVGGVWRAAFCFGADFLFSIGQPRLNQPTDTPKAARHIPLHVYGGAADFLRHLPVGAALVGVEIVDGAVDLADYAHPQRAVYVLGPEDGSLSPDLLDACNSVVSIATRRCLNVAQAASIMLYDRMVKA